MRWGGGVGVGVGMWRGGMGLRKVVNLFVQRLIHWRVVLFERFHSQNTVKKISISSQRSPLSTSRVG